MSSLQLAELIGKRWGILEELYNEELTAKELSFKLKKPLSWISNQIAELKQGVLVDFANVDGRKLRLTEKGRRLCSAVMEASRERGKVPAEALNLQIRALEDGGLPADIRQAAAGGLLESCRDGEIVGDKARLRDFFTRALDRMGEYAGLGQVYSALGEYVDHQITAEDAAWLKGSCYPKAKVGFEGGSNLEAKLSTLEVLSHIYQRCGKGSGMEDVAEELLKTLQEAFLSAQEDERVVARCWEIFRLYVRGGGEWDAFMERVYREAKSKANDAKVRDRCQRYLVKALRSAEALRRS